MSRSQIASVVVFALAAPAVAAAPASRSSDPRVPAGDRSDRVEKRTLGDRTSVALRGFESIEAPQERSVWCWAACAEMILRFEGQAESQDQIAARIHGYEGDGARVAAASRYEVYRALCPDAAAAPLDAFVEALATDLAAAAARAAARKGSRASIEVGWSAERAAQIALDRVAPPKGVPIEQLERGNPAVVGMRDAAADTLGHLYVLVGATYRARGALERGLLKLGDELLKELSPEARAAVERFKPGAYEVLSVVLVDPMAHDDPATEADEMRVVLPFERFAARVDFVTTRPEAREILGRFGGLAQVKVR